MSRTTYMFSSSFKPFINTICVLGRPIFARNHVGINVIVVEFGLPSV